VKEPTGYQQIIINYIYIKMKGKKKGTKKVSKGPAEPEDDDFANGPK
jgi:hypothetical protein